MRRLPLLVPLGERECPADFLSRLAMRNCRGTMRKLAGDYGLDAQAVIDGKPEALAELSALGGVDLQPLLGEAFVTVGRSVAVHYKGHKLSRLIHLSRDQVRMCPACMREDLDAQEFRVEARPYRRSHWILNHIRTCERHCTSLVRLGGMTNPATSQDTSLVVAKAIPLIEDVERRSVARTPSDLEAYVLRRLDGVVDASWLDRLPLHVVLQTSALFGCATLHGVKAKLSDLDEDARWHSDAAGFEIVRHGEDSIREGLDRLIAAAWGSHSSKGTNSLLGQVHCWLSESQTDEDFDPVRKIVADRLIDTLPFGPGERLFGRVVPIRRIHSVTTASLEYGIALERMWSTLIQGGWVKPSRENNPSWELFDAIASEPFLENVKSSMTWEQVMRFINAPKAHREILLKAGFIEPWMRARAKGLKNHAFLRRDVEDFLAKLMSQADERLGAEPGFHTIAAAQKRVMCGVEAIVRLILEGRLRRIGKRVGLSGYGSLLVDVSEVERILKRPVLPGIPVKDVAAALSCPAKAVRALIANGHLTYTVYRSPKNNLLRKAITQTEVRRFDAEYISLVAISKSRNVHPLRMLWALDKAGLSPEFPEPMNFYRRSEVDLPGSEDDWLASIMATS